MDKKRLSHELLSPTIKMLGETLGEVIIEQSSQQVFELEEKLRLAAKRFREDNNDEAFNELVQEISKLSPSDRILIIKAFSLFFQLVNLAEEDYRIHINELEREFKEDTLQFAIKHALKANFSWEKLTDLLQEIHFKLVWTAHPTEARRLTNMMKLRKIYSLIGKFEKVKEGTLEYIKIKNSLKEQITLLWQSDDLREEKVRILDEVRTNLFYFNNTVLDVLPTLLKDFEFAISNVYREISVEDIEIPNFIEFGSWVGGDRDGHPGVTSEITIQTLLLQKRLCLRNYQNHVQSLIRDLSSSLNTVEVDDILTLSIEADSETFKNFASQTSNLNRLEPYRRKLDFIRIKLENTLEEVERTAVEVGLGRTLVGFQRKMDQKEKAKNTYYKRSSEFLVDLKIIDSSLRNNKATVVAEGELSILILKVQIFGFHLAPLDLRQHSKIHEDAISDILNQIGQKTSFENLELSEKREFLLNELTNQRPLGLFSFLDHLNKQSVELIQTLQVAKTSLIEISPRSIESYIISMTRNEVDILTLMLLMKETGLIKIEGNNVIEASLDIVPLFETKEDLDNAAAVMESLFQNHLYRSYLRFRENTQEIMIGYSDSTKDVGYLQSNYRLLTSQINLLEVAKKYSIKLRIFHGRGGSISRGGGSAYDSILGQPPGTMFRMKITEQGEVIGSNYSNPEIAYRHLEQIISAMVVRSINDVHLTGNENPAAIDPDYLTALREIADTSSDVYEELVKRNTDFIKFYMVYTPLDLIERTTIGSRPSRRTAGDVEDISGLRAIPWVFSWMQSRLVFPGYYGVGSAIKKFVARNGIEKLRAMYKNWPYFKSIIDNLQMVCFKVDLKIADQYYNLISEDDGRLIKIFDRIKSEYNLTVKMIFEIVQISSLLENSPDTQNSIIRRNPYIDPLSIIQINLLKSWRGLSRPEDLSKDGLQRALLQTVNGISAGLRNTG